MVDIPCGKCTKGVRRKTGNWMSCDGFCSAVFHLECVSLCESDLLTCATKNILWICDACLPKMWEIKNRYTAIEPTCLTDTIVSAVQTESINDQIAQLKSDVANITATVQQLIAGSCTPVENNKSHSTPISLNAPYSSRLLCGTGGTKSDSPSFAGCTTSSPSRRFWMFFTRIGSHTTEDDIRKLVRNSLHYDGEIAVRKLVPPWKDTSTMDYISFKVGITQDLKNVAMETSTWPKGLRFRPFQNTENDIWEPSSI